MSRLGGRKWIATVVLVAAIFANGLLNADIDLDALFKAVALFVVVEGGADVVSRVRQEPPPTDTAGETATKKGKK